MNKKRSVNENRNSYERQFTNIHKITSTDKFSEKGEIEKLNNEAKNKPNHKHTQIQ